MIRNLLISADLANIMNDGPETCNTAAAALHLYFREHVYTRSREQFIHPSLIDEHIINILTTAFHKDEPQIKSMFKIEIVREKPTDYVMDIHVLVDDVFRHLVDATEGSMLCH